MNEHFEVGAPEFDAPDIQKYLNELPAHVKAVAREILIGGRIHIGDDLYRVTGYADDGLYVLMTRAELLSADPEAHLKSCVYYPVRKLRRQKLQ